MITFDFVKLLINRLALSIMILEMLNNELYEQLSLEDVFVINKDVIW